MNKKQYLEARRELDTERERKAFERFDRLFTILMFVMYSIANIICYYLIIFNPTGLIIPKMIYWLTGAITIMWLAYLSEVLTINKKEVK